MDALGTDMIESCLIKAMPQDLESASFVCREWSAIASAIKSTSEYKLQFERVLRQMRDDRIAHIMNEHPETSLCPRETCIRIVKPDKTLGANASSITYRFKCRCGRSFREDRSQEVTAEEIASTQSEIHDRIKKAGKAQCRDYTELNWYGHADQSFGVNARPVGVRSELLRARNAACVSLAF